MIIIATVDNLVNTFVLSDGKNTTNLFGYAAVFNQYQNSVNVRIYGNTSSIQLKHRSKYYVSDCRITLMCSMYCQKYDSFKKYGIKKRFITIGSTIDSDIYIQDSINKVSISIDTLDQTINSNLSYVPNSYKYGQCIYIENIKIVLAQDFIVLNDVNNIFVSLPKYQYYQNDYYLPNNTIQVNQRIQFRSINLSKSYEEMLPEPLPIYDRSYNPIIFSIGPALTMGMAALASGLISFYNGSLTGRPLLEMLPSLLFPSVMLFSALIWNPSQRLFERINQKRKKRERLEEYSKHLESIENRLITFIHNYFKSIKESFYEPNVLCGMIDNHLDLISKSIKQNDYLYLYIGKGLVEFDINLELKTRLQDNDEIRIKINQLVDKYRFINEESIVISFIKYKTINVIAPKDNTIEIFFYLLIQIISYYDSEQINLCIITNTKQIHDYPFLLMIPNTYINGTRYIFVDDYELDLSDTSYQDMICINISGHDIKERQVFKSYISIKDSKEILYDTDLLLDFDTLTIKHDDKSYSFNYVPISNIDYENILIQYINHYLPSKSYSSINTYSFFDLYPWIDIMSIDIEKRWDSNTTQESISVPIGIDVKGNINYINLHETGDGPHGLIAGMTGSGKSELIISLILSLAINYSPRELNLAIIDFKGGETLSIFSNNYFHLPHIIGELSNLAINDMKRALVSFRLECKEREASFRKLSNIIGKPIKNISDYQKEYIKDFDLPYYASLVIVVDEFAELKKEKPEFLNELVSISRIGRSLGIHLILITQKPAGIINDQIWSNSRFKICLKTQDKQDSNEVLHSDVASRIKKPGEFYLLVDNNMKHLYSGYSHASLNEDNKIIELDIQHNIKRITQIYESEDTQIGYLLGLIKDIRNYKSNNSLWLKPIDDNEFNNNISKSSFALLDDYEKKRYLNLDILDTHLTSVFCPDRSEVYNFINALVYVALEVCETFEEIYIINYQGFNFSYLNKFPNVIDILDDSDDEKIENMFKHLIEVEEKNKLLIIGDLQVLYSTDDKYRMYMNRLYSIAQKNHIYIYMFGSNSASIPFKDLINTQARIALKNDNTQELSNIFECSIKERIYESNHMLYKRDSVIEGMYRNIKEEDFCQILNIYQHNDKNYHLPYIPNTVSISEYSGINTPLGIDIETYEWVDWDDRELIVVSMYEEEYDVFFELHKGRDNFTYMILANYELSSNHNQAVLYIGDSFNNQYTFRIKSNHKIGEKEGVLIDNRKVRIIRLCDKE